VTTDEREALEDKIERTNKIEYLYCFADKYDIPVLRYEIIDHVWYQLGPQGRETGLQSILLATQLLDNDSPLYRLLSDGLMQSFDDESMKCKFDRWICQQLPADIFLQMVLLGYKHQPHVIACDDRRSSRRQHIDTVQEAMVSLDRGRNG
jgi:hypothetical protein